LNFDFRHALLVIFFEPRRLGALAFQPALRQVKRRLALVQALHQLLGGDAALPQGRISQIQHAVRHSPPFRDQKRVALAGYAHQKAVCRGQLVRVEFHACRFHGGRGQGVLLDRVVMCGGQGQGAAVSEGLQNRYSKGGPLVRVGAGPKLVQKNQGFRGRSPQNSDDVFKMRAERG